ncbi:MULTISPECIES: hypothetical protein [unclassified Rhodosalinus]|uniref:hypothetical protein n=1 Tax=unclassified Rhodosalinus TaxID=2630183 RepID=UPI0035258C4C
MMLYFLKTFRKRDDGAVTVDWVVLTAAVVALAVVAYVNINDNAMTLSTATANQIPTDLKEY